MRRWIGSSSNLSGKTRMRMRIYRAETGKWEELGLFWYLKQFFRELFIQIANFFRKEKGYATVLTSVGETWIRDKLHESVQTTGDFIAWGTGTGIASKSSTALFSEASEARVTATRTTPTANRIQWVGTMTANAAKTITNAGNFTASTGGTLIVHGDFTGISLAAGDKIEFTIQLDIT